MLLCSHEPRLHDCVTLKVCGNNRTGGVFEGSAAISLSLVSALQQAGDAIKYSIDGTEPTTPYTSPLTITQTTTVRAVKIAADGAPAGVARNVTYWKAK